VKQRIEELAERVDSWNYGEGPSFRTIEGAITEAVNEALELAAETAKRFEPDERTSYVEYPSDAIRKLKVKP